MKALQDKYTAIVDKLDEKHLYCIFGSVLFFIFVIYYLIFLGPQFSNLSKIITEIKLKAEEIERANSDIKMVSNYETKVKDLKQKLLFLNSRFVSRDDFSFILENISRIALNNGVKIDQIMPEPQNQELLLDNKDRKYYSLPISVEARSSYHTFGKFLNQLENESIILKVDKFTISSSNNSRFHEIKLTLRAVVYSTIN